MTSRTILHAGLVSLVALGGAGAAEAAITITNVAITAGKLVVEGASPGGTQIMVDGKYKATINAVTRKFKLTALYHPDDCIIDVTLIGGVAPAVRAVVGNCGQAGPTYLGQTSFEDVTNTLSLVTPTTLAGFSVTPPVTGRLLVRARGSCDLDSASGAETRFNIYATDTPLTPDTGAGSGPVYVPEDANIANYHVGWTLEKSFAVTAGVAKAVYIDSIASSAAVASAICHGTVSAEIFTKQLTLGPPPP